MDVPILLTAAGAMLGTVAIIAAASLKGFTAWIEFKRGELQQGPASPGVGGRIEVADLKERVRKLEAIAAGVDL